MAELMRHPLSLAEISLGHVIARSAKDVDLDEVAPHFEHAAHLGADVRGEGEIEPRTGTTEGEGTQSRHAEVAPRHDELDPIPINAPKCTFGNFQRDGLTLAGAHTRTPQTSGASKQPSTAVGAQPSSSSRA